MKTPLVARHLAVLFLSAVSGAAQNAPKPQPDYGPFRSATVGGDWHATDVVPKGIVVELGGHGAAVFDTDLCRLAFAWEGPASGPWMEWRGTAYDGAHGTNPRLAGRQIVGTMPLPGHAGAGAESDDPRPIPFGPAPGHRYRGLFRQGRRVALSYELAGRGLHESHRLLGEAGKRVFQRSLEIAPGDAALRIRVLGRRGGVARAAKGGRLAWIDHRRTRGELVNVDRRMSDFAGFEWRPSKEDYADASSGNGVTLTWVPGYSKPHARAGGGEDRSLPRAFDGELPRNDDDTERNVWFDGKEARLHMDLQKVVEVRGLHFYSWHRSNRAPQNQVVYASSDAKAPEPGAAEPSATGWVKVAECSTEELGDGGLHAAFVRREGQALGRFRHLLVVSVRPEGRGTFFSEIDVWAGEHRASRRPDFGDGTSRAMVAVTGAEQARLRVVGEELFLEVPPSEAPQRLSLVHAAGSPERCLEVLDEERRDLAPESPRSFVEPGPALWPKVFETRGRLGKEDRAFAVDTIVHPQENPWGTDFRFAAFDFFEDGRAAVSTWNGDVWVVSGIDEGLQSLRWRRFASGLYDPLGLKIVDGVIHTHGRDQITQLLDHDGDGEADEYRNFFNGIYVTKNFHEFAFDLQTDAAGNFYFSKGGPVRPGGRGFEKIAPHHGTLLKLDPGGEKLEVLATGLRAPNGVGVRADGLVSTGDNEGTWMPKCRLNLFRSGYFAGCMDTAHRNPAPKRYDLPVCWMPMDVDNSGGAQIWVDEPRFGAFPGRLLHLSYGTCRLYLVMLQELREGVWQGGVTRIPASFASSLMRARFGPRDGALYVSGLKGWQTRAAKRTALQRVRRTERALRMLESLESHAGEIRLRFTCKLDEELVSDVQSWSLSMWNYLWTSKYGSPHVSVRDPEKKGKKVADPLRIDSAQLAADGRSVVLKVPELVPAMQLKLTWNLEDPDGELVEGAAHFTIHELPAGR